MRGLAENKASRAATQGLIRCCTITHKDASTGGVNPCLSLCPVPQAPVPTKPTPRGDKDCPKDCSGVGNCHYDTGTCYCPAGYGGDDCSLPRKRPCWRMGTDKRDEGWHKFTEWSHSRCAGQPTTRPLSTNMITCIIRRWL